MLKWSVTETVASEGLGVDDGREVAERLRLQVEGLGQVDGGAHAPFGQN